MNYRLTEPHISQLEETSLQTAPQPAFSWLTGEVALYGLLVIISAGLRLANLGGYPLNDAEAGQALAALAVFHGSAPAEAANYSPLQVSLTSLFFLLFGPADASARLGSVVLGVSLVLLPAGLRRQLGRPGALLASTLFAFSASGLFWSRLAAGEMAAAVGALLILVGLVQGLEGRAKVGLWLIVSGLVLLLLSAPAGFTALVIFLVMAALATLTNREALSTAQAQVVRAGVTLGQVALVGAGLLVVLGSAALFNLTGLAAVSGMFDAWLSQFGLVGQPGAGYPALLMLFFYEPVIVLFGLIGLVNSFKRQRLFDWALVFWLGLAIILDLFMGGRRSGQMLLALIPLTLLAGQSIGRLLEQLFSKGRWEAEGLLIGFGLILGGFTYITLTSWARCLPDQPGCDTAWVLPTAGLALLAALFAIFWGWYGLGVAWRGCGALLLIALSLFSIGASWRLNYGPLKNLPFQPMLSQPASTRLLTLLEDLSRLSAERTGDPRQLDLAVVDLNRPMLRWHLREFARARFVANFAAAGGAPVIVASAGAGQPLEGGYAGQDLALINHWAPNVLEGKYWARWYLFRFLPNHIPGSDQIILWVKQE